MPSKTKKEKKKKEKKRKKRRKRFKAKTREDGLNKKKRERLS